MCRAGWVQKLIGSSVPLQLFTCTHNGLCECHHGEAEGPVSVPRNLGHPGTGQVSLHPQQPQQILAWVVPINLNPS